MKRMSAVMVSLCLIGIAVYVSQAARQAAPDDAARAAALQLYRSLTDEQKKLAVKEFSDKDRYTEQFPAVVRPGLPIKNLSAEQKVLVDAVIKATTSEYGAKRCLEVAKQTGEDRRYVNFFGVPAADTPFAWRVAAHHLTLIHAEFLTFRTSV